ncbi:hypothetical protein AAG906_021901 [Vitis piasezkii]
MNMGLVYLTSRTDPSSNAYFGMVCVFFFPEQTMWFLWAILMFLAHFFPLSERSAFVLPLFLFYAYSCEYKGVFNTSNETKYEKDALKILVCEPEYGGLGLGKVSLRNRIILGKWLWSLSFLRTHHSFHHFESLPVSKSCPSHCLPANVVPPRPLQVYHRLVSRSSPFLRHRLTSYPFTSRASALPSPNDLPIAIRKECFSSWWRGFEGNGWEGHKFMRKLQYVKAKLKDWNKNSFGMLKERKKSILDEIANIDVVELEGVLSSDLLAQRVLRKGELEELILRKKFIRDKS